MAEGQPPRKGSDVAEELDLGASGAAATSESGYPASVRLGLSQASRMLLIRLRSLGDSLLSLPLVEALHEWRRELQLDVLIEPPFAAVFAEHPAIHETLVLRPRNWPAGDGWSKSRAILEVRRRRYQAVVNLHGGTTSQLITLTSGAGLRIGYEHYRRSWAYNVRIPASSDVWKREGIHTVEHLLTLPRWLDIPIGNKPRGTLYLAADGRKRVLERLERLTIPHLGFLLVHPTATLFTKQWPPARFGQLADQLCREYTLPVIFTSSPEEAQVLIDIGQHAQEKHHYWSDLALNELFVLVEACRVFIGNDSGPTHAAAALHKPVVVVWGSSNRNAWHPWETDYELISSELPCMPCPGYTCAAFGEPKCILDIPVQRVLEACRRIIARTTRE